MMWTRLRAMIAKEFAQLAGDVPILCVLLWGFTGAIYLGGHGAAEIQNYPVAVLDLARGPESRELLSRIRPPYFKVVAYLAGDRDVVEYLDAARASLVVVIPPDFERRVRERQGSFQVVSDGTFSMSATVAGAYLARIASDYNVDAVDRLAGARLRTRAPSVDARVRIAYNANMDAAWFTGLLELFNIITMVSMLLTAAALIREKERGTLDQLVVTPLHPAELFAAKIIPTVITVLGLSLFGLLAVVHGVLGAPIRGSVVLFYAVTVLYVFAIASLGIAIAVVARNIAQGMLLLLLLLYPMLFLSGAWTPPESMAPWMRWASLVSPMRHYIDFGSQVLFKGNGLADVWTDVVGIVVIGLAMFGWSVARFRQLVRR